MKRLIKKIIFAGLIFLSMSRVNAAEAKIVHVFVALCDNKNQGIVPVPEALGKGNDPADNLYWGALYGLKTHFKKSQQWQLVKTRKNYSPLILERIVFKHKGKDIYLIADAYEGSKIKQATIAFLNASGGKELNTDLAVYIGHNGLIGDFIIDKKKLFKDKNDREHPASIVLCCKSSQYFSSFLDDLKSEKLLLTTNFMAPEAYTLEAALDAYAKGEDQVKMKENAAQAYNEYQKCGINAARNLFK